MVSSNVMSLKYMLFSLLEYHLTNYWWLGMVKDLTGGYIIKYHANGVDKDPIEIDFTPPFRSLLLYFVNLYHCFTCVTMIEVFSSVFISAEGLT